MPKSPSRPTRGELEILRAIWDRGPSTVREVYGDLGQRTAYTSVLKLMQIMATKGLLVRDDRARTHVYRATQGEAQTQRHLARDLMNIAFGGSARKLVVAALASKKSSPRELEEIRELLNEMKRGGS